MEFLINQVATCGCELLNQEKKIIGWSVDKVWAEIIKKA